MWYVSVLFGLLVGVSLGLTGGGGAIFAVPMLVYGLDIPAREAVGISLAAVGATSFVGFLHRWKLGEVELRTGWLFAIAGMIGAPLGTWLSRFVSDAVLLLAFAGVMVVVAVRMWRQASRSADPRDRGDEKEIICHRDAAGVLNLTRRCTVLMLVVGLLTGVLSGLFGVGGGFVIVPALVLFSGLSMHRAVGTSLMVIALVSVSGIASQIWSGRAIPPLVTGLFTLGGVAGLFIGQRVGRRLSGPLLQRVFVVAILAVAAFVVTQNLQS